jgi:hypothetical protein
MNEYNTDKKYKPFKIPDRQKAQESGVSKVQPQNRHYTQMSLSDGLFYEIEYDNSPFPGVGKFVLKSQEIVQPQKDPIRELFYRMRDIARQYPIPDSYYSWFFDKRVQKWNARIFYNQAVFPWVGTRRLTTLNYALRHRRIKSKLPWPTCVYLEVIFDGTKEELENIIMDILHSDLDMYDLPLPDKVQIEGKYNEFIPLELLRKQFIKDYLDFEGLQRDMLS